MGFVWIKHLKTLLLALIQLTIVQTINLKKVEEDILVGQDHKIN